MEIILVNDGSPDNCGAIANDYQAQDSRIRVIHKENGGLSDARNAGMELVTGTFTMFVDSDDWLERTMIETMIYHCKEFVADVVQSDFYYAYDDKLLVEKREDIYPICLDNRTLMYELVKNDQVKNFAWGKLYKTDIIKDIPFKKGVLFEDVFWAHQVMHHVSTYVILQQPFYYYCQRDDSIVATYSTRNLDILKGLKERHSFLELYYEDLIHESYQLILKTSFDHYHLLRLHKKIDKQGEHRKAIEMYIQENYSKIKLAIQHQHGLKCQLYLFSLHPYFQRIYQWVIWGLRKTKVLSQPTRLKQVNV